MQKISIIIRTKNEEKWIGPCLEMIFSQDYDPYEVIIVDNCSTDRTLHIASRYPIKSVVNIADFKPGFAINEGIRSSTGEYIACISAHCIPKSNNWLRKLFESLELDSGAAGVYGRQLPMAFTDDVDKRDMLIVFGNDRKIQIKDYFFHNANSLFKRRVWEMYPFDEDATNIEDRIWGKRVVDSGYRLIYEPDAEVFHYHGLHHGNDAQRAKGVVSIIERIEPNSVNEIPKVLLPENIKVDAVLVIGLDEPDVDFLPRLKSLINSLEMSAYIDHIHVVGVDPRLAINNSFIDRNSLICEKNNLEELLSAVVDVLELRGRYPDKILYVNNDYLYRPSGIFDTLVTDAQFKGCDSVFCGYKDYGHYWYQAGDTSYQQVDDSLGCRESRVPVYKGLYGLGTVTNTNLVKRGKIIGGKVGIVPVDDFSFTLRSKEIKLLTR